MLEAIDRDTYEVVPIGIATDGRWVLESGDPERLRIEGPDRLPSVDADGAAVALERVEKGTDLVVTEPSQPPRTLGEVDVVFPLLHGPFGEDGTIQGMLEMAGVRYVGAGVLASAVSMDKTYMKVVLSAAGLPVMPSFGLHARDWARDPEAVRYPCGGARLSAVREAGARRLEHRDREGPRPLRARRAIEGALLHDPKILVEVAAEGAREVECGVLQSPDGTAETSVPAEIRVTGDHEFYDFEAKYLPEEATELDVPADLPEQTATELRALAARAFEAVGCEGLARVDFFVMPDGSLVVNELNTMPGFTPLSMFPRMWAATGVDYPTLVDRLIRLALARDTGLR